MVKEYRLSTEQETKVSAAIRVFAYVEEFTCSPPTFVMIGLTLLELAMFAYTSIAMSQSETEPKPITWTGPVPYCSHLIFNPRRRWEWWRFISYMLVASSFLILSLESSYYKHLFPTPFYPKSFISAMHQSNDIQDLRFSIFTYQTFVQPNFLSHIPSHLSLCCVLLVWTTPHSTLSLQSGICTFACHVITYPHCTKFAASYILSTS